MKYTSSRRDFIKLNIAAIALLTGCQASLPKETKLPIETIQSVSNVSLEVKIGQMLLVGFRGITLKDQAPIVQDIQDRHIGGVLLYDYDIAQKQPIRNIQSPLQVKALTKALQAYAKIPLLVGIDYEGGKINRLSEKYGFPATVSHQYLGEQDDLAFTYQQATKLAQTLSGLGVNLNFAPVVDVNTNPNNPIIAKKERSFSTDPNIVAKHAIEFIKAHRQQKVLCTPKHFPGHGSSTSDSHIGVADVTNTWSPIELEPYVKMIQAGEVDAIMTAHVFNRKIDPHYPATLSKHTMTRLLRKELNFNGVVFSDDMQMRAIANHYGLETAVALAIEAGVDVIVIGNNTGVFEPDIAKRVIAIIKGLVQNGTISDKRIDESYQRIRRLKQQL